ncbi:Multidrug resistance regulator 1 [Lachnellula cervina]|uniref:Multidrug resistance regulator 1 n=1 Tax=Lachnellula cervina TaxID=1316786 RepID=A0A7D8UMA6_9HELO|nr:Multidrug resistance regulator 1 [Lachnellula cervina]
MDPNLEQASRSTSPPKPPRKRKRIVISCTECHRRKQKCDRESPCSNCIARNKNNICHYENESARKQQLLEDSVSTAAVNGGAFSVIKPNAADTVAQVTGFGYNKSNGNNNTTLGIFKKLQDHDAQTPDQFSRPETSMPDQSGLREKYKSLIRQLPSKEYIEKLLPTYFREVNCSYSPLDEGYFRDLLAEWHGLSFATLNRGPQELSGDMQFFPALLFQCLALALQFQPLEYDPTLDSLKYAAGMSFDDLASDYSESSVGILGLLGKRHTTLVAVQAGFLRTSYLKNVGMVTESWHSLSQTIRDAQEIGLHKDSLVHSRNSEAKPADVLENLWIEQFRRRMWLIISLWDIHMAIILGRPTTIDPRDGKPPFPIDAPFPRNRREEAPSPRTEADVPTTLTMLLWNTEVTAPLWDIFILEKEDPHQNNFAKVEKMHKLINQISLHYPPFFRTENPDLTFDALPECYWLPRARPVFQNNAAFTIMALHRPYIFTNSSSRTAALKAGLDVLRAQRTLFNLLNSTHYKWFVLVLNTFDAIILIAAIYILHPCENRSDLDEALQHFGWAKERFQMMSSRNSMARTALGVVKAIHLRLNKALNIGQGAVTIKTASNTASPTPETVSSTTTPNQTYPPLSTHPSTSSASSNTNSTPAQTSYTLPTISNLTSPPTSIPASWEQYPTSFDFSSMPVLQPMHDLVYKDLGSGMETSSYDVVGTWDAGSIGPSGGEGMAAQPWMFEGDFGSDSFWGIMNSYNP